MNENSKITLHVPDSVEPALLTGPGDELLRQIERSFSSKITMRGSRIDIEGDHAEVDAIALVFTDMIKHVQSGSVPNLAYLRNLIALSRAGDMLPEVLRNDVILTHRGRSVRPKTAGQKRYVDAIRNNVITFGTGPAGTGKTYLAVACALADLNAKRIGRIVLSRPIVEAGESLGFLPGTLMEKVDPYMRPLYDSLYDMEDFEKVNQLIDNGIVEIVPLAFMRGRTLNDSFIILDEAQNATPEQMKMLLTRLGFGSKIVVTGDATQTDLPHGTSGLGNMRNILAGIDNIAFCDFSGVDVVRNPLVAEIVSAYERYTERQSSRNEHA